MAEPIGQGTPRVHYYQGNPDYPFTIIDKNEDGVLKPEDGDIIYQGMPDAWFPSLNRINHSLWKNQKTEDVEKIIAQYMAENNNLLWLMAGYGAFVCFLLVFRRLPLHRSLLLQQNQGNSNYPPMA
ncbi:MAG: hypothetical protein A2W61_03915 [Deltaproteobacteria bacterium RIFCSPLOWO2_01_44_7]|nr:MAG: hypothetical protein A2712_07585 [Deltaproteobacteria bacterium RIFCSPHIGHO2_01_FULL_43_49]OGQ14796.1 MAG: hypothetical protein A3D22_09410 [Deltaproteobacteria bacterium RIFCSPHIGHO2_02_FULL_44_53]OGQ28182.1 MAG: hypothetical protein A3D98_08120 [Deltaproteobacteria bacterium RIFCSPHIGHO2_12_FULL_44_21]OGQ31394.1 MAG: hypothetical protein A2979_08170 [Deltaproteobacteria bacterium RIFCSPLOWO2_01_FULL_45_74]OGQ39594.1 MAG: hypothetical protein A2W61_03915 [Deltaproteobacteria bacterium 